MASDGQRCSAEDAVSRPNGVSIYARAQAYYSPLVPRVTHSGSQPTGVLSLHSRSHSATVRRPSARVGHFTSPHLLRLTAQVSLRFSDALTLLQTALVKIGHAQAETNLAL